MPKYRVKTNWSGYSRGTEEYIIDADNEDVARECFYEGEGVNRLTIRDDTEHEIETVELLD